MNLFLKTGSWTGRRKLVGIGIAAVTIAALSASSNIVPFIADWMVKFAFYPNRMSDPEQWKWSPLDRVPFEVKAVDGTVLRGLFASSKINPSVGTIVFLHGHGSCADHMAFAAKQAADAGFNAVVYDARAHGKSDGSVCSFGIKEADDAKQIAQYLQNDRGIRGPIFLWGFSLGASVGAQALAGDTPFSGGVLFSPFSDLDAIISSVLVKKGLWWLPGLKGTIQTKAREVIGVLPSEVSPQRAATQIRVPVLIVHGTCDARIPVEQGRAVYEAIPHTEKEFLQLPNGGHEDLIDMKKPWGAKTLAHVFEYFRAIR